MRTPNIDDHLLLTLQVVGSYIAGPFEAEQVDTVTISVTVENLTEGETAAMRVGPFHFTRAETEALQVTWRLIADRISREIGTQDSLFR